MADNVWSSTGSTDANTAANWSLGRVPTAGDTAVWNATSVVNCTLSALISCDAFRVETGYTGTLSFGAHGITGGDMALNIGTGGTINLGSGTITCNGDFGWPTAAGTINRETSHVVLTGTGGLVVPFAATPRRELHAVTINAGAVITASGSVPVFAGLFTLNGSLIADIGGQGLTFTGGFTQGATGEASGTGVLYWNSGAITLAAPDAIRPAQLWVLRSVAIPPGHYQPTSLFRWLNANAASTFTWSAGTYRFSDVRIDATGANYTFDGATNSPTIHFEKNLWLNATTGQIIWSKGGTVNFTGASNQTYTDGTAAIQDIGVVEIDKAAGTVLLGSAMECTSLTGVSGALDLSGRNLTVSGAIEFQAGFLLANLAGSTITYGTLTATGQDLTATAACTLTGGTTTLTGVTLGESAPEGHYPDPAYVHSDAGTYGFTGTEYTPALSALANWCLIAGITWPALDEVDGGVQFGPVTGEEFEGEGMNIAQLEALLDARGITLPGGERTRTIHVTGTESANISGARVRIYLSDGQLRDEGVTIANGKVTLSAPVGTHRSLVHAAGYQTLDASDIEFGDGVDTDYSAVLTALPAITPPDDPELSRARIYTRLGGVYKPGMLVQVQQTGPVPGEVNIGDGSRIREFRSNTSSYVDVDMARNAPHQWRMGITGQWEPFTPTTNVFSVNASVGDEF